MASNRSVLEQCLAQVMQRAPLVLSHCIDQVIAALHDAEGKSLRTSERIELAEAWHELLQHKATWCRLYPAELQAAFSRMIENKPAHAPAVAPGGGDHPADLTLVDDDEVTQAIATSRLVQNVMPRLEKPVSELDGLVSSVMGLETVQADRNPVRPEVFALALRELFGKTAIKATTSSLWLKYVAEPLGLELQQLYEELLAQLKSANVQAAGYGRAPGAGVASGARQSAHDEFAQTEAPAQEALGSQPAAGDGAGQPFGRALLRAFLRRGDGAQGSQPPPQAYYAGVREELADLRRRSGSTGSSGQPVTVPRGYRELPPVDRPTVVVGVHSALSPQVWGDYGNSHERAMVRSRLRQDVTQMSQALGLELVREVVDQVARDPRLLTPVREAIVALEPSLLRLAMVDPRFFTEVHHPGRQLMERVAQRSFRYNDEFSGEFDLFFAEISRRFNALNQSRIADAQPFQLALGELESLWERQDRDDEARHMLAVEAVRFAELRHAEAEQIADGISRRPDLTGVPEVVQDFLFGPWSLVLAHARLTGNGRDADPGGYQAVISDLLWSVKPEVTLRLPAQLFKRVPPLLAKLREGLASLGQDPAEHEAFFQELMKLHHPVLKLRRAKSRRDARESGLPSVARFDASAPSPAAAQAPATPAGQPWMSPRELDAAGFEQTLPTGAGELMPESGPSGTFDPGATVEESPGSPGQELGPASSPAIDPAAILAKLREGDWVDLYSKRAWHRAQLVWAGSRGTLFMFVSHGGRPHSMTKRICERLIGERYLRPVDAHEVVAHALDALDRETPVS
jgi:hypothetical protein